MSPPVFSRPRWLPASKINGAHINHAIISDGCIINHANISHSIIGIRSIVGSGSDLNRVVLLGGDYYESHASILETKASENLATAAAKTPGSTNPVSNKMPGTGTTGA